MTEERMSSNEIVSDARLQQYLSYEDAREKAEYTRAVRKRLGRLRRIFGDDEALFHAMGAADWSLALREFADAPALKAAFMRAWVQFKDFPVATGDYALMCRVARVLLPPYRGPTLRLFRAATRLERRRRAYGLSWTSNFTAAERLAENRRGVVLETIAAPEAVIAKIIYGPDLANYRGESEYVVDRRRLSRVTIKRAGRRLR